MSETATVETTTAAPAADAPVPAEPTAAPEPQAPQQESPAEPQPTGPLSKAQARAAAREHARKVAERAQAEQSPMGDKPEPVVDATGRVHDPVTGKYLPKEGEPDTAVTSGELSPEAAAQPPEGEATEPAAKPQVYRVELPQDHALRAQGLDALEASTPEQERAIRALLNGTYTRRQEAEKLTAKVAELEAKLVQQEASKAASDKYKASPQYQARAERFHKMRELEATGELPEGTASEWWRDVASIEIQNLEKGEVHTRMQAIAAQREVEAAEAWKNEAWSNVSGRLPQEIRSIPSLNVWFDDAVEDFNNRLDKGRYPQFDTPDFNAKPEHERRATLEAEFTKLFNSHLLQQGSVREAFARIRDAETRKAAEARTRAEQAAREKAAREKAAAEQAAVEKFKREAAEKRQANPPHPLGRVNGAVRTDVSAVDGTPAAQELPADRHGMMSQLRQRARERARSSVPRP